MPQAIAVAEAVERGLNRRAKEGKPVADMTPVCTIMIGRLDDWLQIVAKRDTIVVDPGALHWAGIAVMKKAYRHLPGARLPDAACSPRPTGTTCTGRS